MCGRFLQPPREDSSEDFLANFQRSLLFIQSNETRRAGCLWRTAVVAERRPHEDLFRTSNSENRRERKKTTRQETLHMPPIRRVR